MLKLKSPLKVSEPFPQDSHCPHTIWESETNIRNTVTWTGSAATHLFCL